MGSEWSRMRIGDVATVFDGPHATPKKTESGPIFLGISSLNSGRLDLTDLEHISEDDFKKWIRRVEPREGDVVFSYETRLGQAAIIPSGLRCCLGRRMGLVRVDTEKLDPQFFLYYYLSPEFQDFLRSRTVHGSTVDRIPLIDFPDFEIPVPPLSEQGELIGVLTGLDHKIALLRETNATLEAIAQALFKSWFVDFDPVRAKAEGRDPEGVPPEVVDLFPSEFEDSDLGAIPKGWRVMPFTGAIDVIGGGTPKTSVESYWNGHIPWFSVVDTPRDGDVFVMDTEKHITSEGVTNSSTRLLRPGTTIISARGTVGKTALVGREMAMNQSCYGLQGRHVGDGQTYFATRRLVSELRQRSHGSVFETITRDTLASVSVVVAPSMISDAFESFIGALLARVKGNVSESESISSLRDTLLPRLMSGKLRVSDLSMGSA